MTKFFSAPQEVQTTELVRTSQSWDGVDLPDYLAGKPEIVGIKYEIPAGQKLGWHDHPVMNHGENRGTKPVVLYMFYLSQEGMPLSVQHPEI